MKTDVLVIGGGLAGKRCAQTAGKKCRTVLIANGRGASPYIHGISVPLGRDDSVELFVRDTFLSGRKQGKMNLIKKLCGESAALKDEFDFTKDGDEYELLKPLGASVPRVAGIDGRTGLYAMNRIDAEKSFVQHSDIRAVRLHCEDNRVRGAYCFNLKTGEWIYIAAKAVVLATGGFGGLFPFSTNSSDIGGDGIAMAYDAGAALCDMEFIQFEPTAAVCPNGIRGRSVITTMLYEGAVMRNKNNDRFMDERVDKDELSLEIYREIIKGNAAEHGGVFYDMTAVDEKLLKGRYADYRDRYLSCGIDIGRQYAEVAPAPHTTLGGIEIDENCKTAVEGLFACGEVTGGIHGANRLGGNAGLEVLVFGKIAGESAAEYAYGKDEKIGNADVTYQNSSRTDVGYMRKRLTEALGNGLNVIRNENDMQHLKTVAAETIDCCRDKAFDFEAQRLHNDAVTVLAAGSSALARKGNMGCHNREDAVHENERYRICVCRNGEQLSLKKEHI